MGMNILLQLFAKRLAVPKFHAVDTNYVKNTSEKSLRISRSPPCICMMTTSYPKALFWTTCVFLHGHLIVYMHYGLQLEKSSLSIPPSSPLSPSSSSSAKYIILLSLSLKMILSESVSNTLRTDFCADFWTEN